MAEIKDCIGKKVRIAKGSITIKSDDGKICGVIRGIISLYDIQANGQMEYYQKLRKLGIRMNDVSIRNVIIKDGELHIFRNMKGKLFHEKHGFFNEIERQKEETENSIYSKIATAGIKVIECVFV